MSLTVPTTSDLLLHLMKDQWDPGSEERFAAEALQLSTDLMELASGVTTTPTEAVAARIITQGICAMAQALMVRRKDADIEYNRFSTERVGSYSYTKAAAAGEKTGVELFDVAVDMLVNSYAEAAGWARSEHVFKEPYGTEEAARQSLVNADAYGR